MTPEKPSAQKRNRGIFRLFELFTELTGWIQIAASPFLIGLAIAAIVYFLNPSNFRLLLAIIITLTGLIAGIIWANKQWKGKGTIWFLSRLMATPELDNKNEEVEEDKNTRNRV